MRVRKVISTFLGFSQAFQNLINTSYGEKEVKMDKAWLDTSDFGFFNSEGKFQ